MVRRFRLYIYFEVVRSMVACDLCAKYKLLCSIILYNMYLGVWVGLPTQPPEFNIIFQSNGIAIQIIICTQKLHYCE